MATKKENSLRGKKARASGQRFEARVREDLEGMGWIVDKWTNTVDYDRDGKIGKVVPAKRKWNPFKKVMVIGTGFPDFIAFRSKANEKNDFPLGEGFCEKCENKSFGYLIEENFMNCEFCGEIINSDLPKSAEGNSDKTEVIGVEVKTNGYLDQTEKGMCFWLLKNKIFSRILIAKKKKVKNRIKVEYKEFKHNKT